MLQENYAERAAASLALGTALALGAVAGTTADMPNAMAQTQNGHAKLIATPVLQALRDALAHPTSGGAANEKAGQFSPTGGAAAVDQMIAQNNVPPAQHAAFRQYALAAVGLSEQAYQSNGYTRNDNAVAWSGLLDVCYEIHKGIFKPSGTRTAKDEAEFKGVVSQMRAAFARTANYQSLSDAEKQQAYTFAAFTTGHFAIDWQQAGDNAEKRGQVQKLADSLLSSAFGVAPDSMVRTSTGYAATSAMVSGATPTKPVGASAAEAGTKAMHASTPPQAPAPVATGPLPAASLHGAQILMQFRMMYSTYITTLFEPLILFPDGTAINDWPSKPVASFDEATLKSSVKPFYVGTWKKQGENLVVTFKGKTETYPRHLNGWYSGSDTPKPDYLYETYYPVEQLPAHGMEGAWENKNLMTMGMVGGAAPMVAAGSNSNFLFRPDGTFSNARDSFASSTTANMGDAFRGEGSVGVYTNNKKHGAGRWRLDGLLLTIESNGQRDVRPAFFLPHFDDKDAPAKRNVFVGTDRWERPEKK